MEIGFDLGNMYVTVDIDYKVYAGEPMFMYYPNGDPGEPGTPPELEILDVFVTSVSGETYDLSQFGDWDKDLDRLARAYVEDSDWIKDQLWEESNDYD